jgi:hypothetical protein
VWLHLPAEQLLSYRMVPAGTERNRNERPIACKQGARSAAQVPAAAPMPHFAMYASHCFQKAARLNGHEPQRVSRFDLSQSRRRSAGGIRERDSAKCARVGCDRLI